MILIINGVWQAVGPVLLVQIEPSAITRCILFHRGMVFLHNPFWNALALLSSQRRGEAKSDARISTPLPRHCHPHAERPWIWFRLRRVKDRKSTRLNSSHLGISYAVFCL